MRTTPEEARRIGEWIVAKLNRMEGPVRFFIPEGGVSLLDAPGQPYWDPEADRVLFDVIATNFRAGPRRALVRRSRERERSRVRPRAGRRVPRADARDGGALPGARAGEGELTMARIERKKILERFRKMVAKKQPIIGGGAGTGLSAPSARRPAAST